jgi:hypothetical protein
MLDPPDAEGQRRGRQDAAVNGYFPGNQMQPAERFDDADRNEQSIAGERYAAEFRVVDSGEKAPLPRLAANGNSGQLGHGFNEQDLRERAIRDGNPLYCCSAGPLFAGKQTVE